MHGPYTEEARDHIRARYNRHAYEESLHVFQTLESDNPADDQCSVENEKRENVAMKENYPRLVERDRFHIFAERHLQQMRTELTIRYYKLIKRGFFKIYNLYYIFNIFIFLLLTNDIIFGWVILII